MLPLEPFLVPTHLLPSLMSAIYLFVYSSETGYYLVALSQVPGFKESFCLQTIWNTGLCHCVQVPEPFS